MDIIISGLLLGGTYALIAMGLNLQYGVARIMNLANGEMLVLGNGRQVRLAVNGLHMGQELQPYLRDHWAGRLHRLGVEVIPYAQLFGVDADTAYLRHAVTGDPILCEAVETVVLAHGATARTDLEQALTDSDVRVLLAGDCLSPRSAEEAVFEGFQAGLDA